MFVSFQNTVNLRNRMGELLQTNVVFCQLKKTFVHMRCLRWHSFCVPYVISLTPVKVSLFRLTDGEERTYGGCEGPDAMYVKLISSDGHEFIVKREHALTSGTIKAMLSGPGEAKFIKYSPIIIQGHLIISCLAWTLKSFCWICNAWKFCDTVLRNIYVY